MSALHYEHRKEWSSKERTGAPTSTSILRPLVQGRPCLLVVGHVYGSRQGRSGEELGTGLDRSASAAIDTWAWLKGAHILLMGASSSCHGL